MAISTSKLNSRRKKHQVDDDDAENGAPVIDPILQLRGGIGGMTCITVTASSYSIIEQSQLKGTKPQHTVHAIMISISPCTGGAKLDTEEQEERRRNVVTWATVKGNLIGIPSVAMLRLQYTSSLLPFTHHPNTRQGRRMTITSHRVTIIMNIHIMTVDGYAFHAFRVVVHVQ